MTYNVFGGTFSLTQSINITSLVEVKLVTSLSRFSVVVFCHIPANQDWCSSGITMATDNWSAAELVNRQSLDDFHSAFDVVFVDTTGYVNLCADMSTAHYRLVFMPF